MSRKYFDLAIVKTNKPNSKKTINEFAEEFGYTDYLQEEVALDKRSIGITIVSDDLIFELENFSKNRTDKFTLNFAKVNKKNSEDFHILKKCEFTEGKMIDSSGKFIRNIEEKDDTKRILIEKEEKALKEKQLANSKNKQNNKQRNNRRNNHKNNNSNKPKGQHKGQQKPNENNPKGQNQQDNKQHQKNNTQKPRSRNHLRRKNKH